MGDVEEGHAFRLILDQIGKLKKGEKLKVGIGVDDTAADTSSLMNKVLAQNRWFGFKPVKEQKEWALASATSTRFSKVYSDLWNKKWQEIKPLLGREAFMMLAETTEPVFVTARSGETAEPLHKWVSEHYGGGARIELVEPQPFELHGIRKLGRGYDILIDDSPHVSAAMKHEPAKGRALLLVNRWSDALKHRNPDNTAVVADAEHAADLIFEAHEVMG